LSVLSVARVLSVLSVARVLSVLSVARSLSVLFVARVVVRVVCGDGRRPQAVHMIGDGIMKSSASILARSASNSRAVM
jgi:hypothetical protein